MSKVKLMQGDNILSLKKLPDNSVDSIVSDPPYGLSFMAKKWDYDVPSVEFWKEVYRVLKPGGHVLSFGGTRTYHRMVVNIEDAGFEIRDQIMWLYGSGFPKSHNIGKAVDKIEGNEREVVGEKTGGAYSPGTKNLGINNVDVIWRKSNIERETKRGEDFGKITKGTSPYEGWGTALKPANEPICVARKPLSEKSVAENVLRWGTGGINIDGCRIGSDSIKTMPKKDGDLGASGIYNEYKEYEGNTHEGRFPANIILDEIAGELLDEQSGISKSSSNKWEGEANIFNDGDKKVTGHKKGIRVDTYSDKGGASRYFYQAKVSKQERNMGLDGFEEKVIEGRDEGQDERNVAYKPRPVSQKNTHPTVKPVALMSYLVRLVTPPNGIVCDPFLGSGSTGIAARLEGFRFLGMEMDEDYFKIAEARIENYEKYRKFIK